MILATFVIILAAVGQLLNCRLVVLNKEELYLDDGDLDYDRIMSQADLINSTDIIPEWCKDALEQQKYYHYYIIKDGIEEQHTIEAVFQLDTSINSRTVTNMEEPWIVGNVILR